MLPKEKDGVVDTSLKVECFTIVDLNYVMIIAAGIWYRESPSGRCVNRTLTFRGAPPV